MVRNLNPGKYKRRITEADENFAKKPDFKDMEFPVKVRDIHKIGKIYIYISININVFVYKHKEKYPIYVSKYVPNKNMLTYYW